MNKSNQGIILGVGIAGGVIAAMAILYFVLAVSQPAQTQTSGGGSDVRVVSFNAERTAGYFTVHYLVTGIINNQGSAESGQIQLRLTVSDHGEPVIQREFTPVTSPLQPGQSAEFSVPFNIDGNIDFQYLVEVISQ